MLYTKIKTLGHKQREFSYAGSIRDGVVLQQSGAPKIDANFFSEALRQFAGQKVFGGFKEDDPPPGGFGAWVQSNSRPGKLNSRTLTPRHGSFVAAILCREAGVESTLQGNAIILRFPK